MCSTVRSKPQLVAVLARVEEAAAADWGRSKQNNGTVGSQWEAMDFGDVLLHVFDEAVSKATVTSVTWGALVCVLVACVSCVTPSQPFTTHSLVHPPPPPLCAHQKIYTQFLLLLCCLLCPHCACEN